MRKRSRIGLISAALLGIGLIGGFRGSASPGASVDFIGAFALVMPDDPDFGGFSAIELSPDGGSFIAVTDRARWTSGNILRDDGGKITALHPERTRVLKGANDRPLVGRMIDSEGIAVAPDGTIYVSFEQRARVVRYADLTGPGTELPVPPDFDDMLRNRSLEALAVDGDGLLYTLPEDTRLAGADFPVYRFDGTDWVQPFTIPRIGSFLPVGADFGPDGRLYLLERSFLGLGGFASRVRVFDITGDRISDGETVLQSAPGLHDNLEGISVWRDTTGAIRLSMVADDNFVFFLRSEIVEYRLPVTAQGD